MFKSVEVHISQVGPSDPVILLYNFYCTMAVSFPLLQIRGGIAQWLDPRVASSILTPPGVFVKVSAQDTECLIAPRALLSGCPLLNNARTVLSRGWVK